MGAVGRAVQRHAVLKLKFPEASNVTGKVGPVSIWPTSEATPLSGSLTLPLTVGLVRVGRPEHRPGVRHDRRRGRVHDFVIDSEMPVLVSARSKTMTSAPMPCAESLLTTTPPEPVILSSAGGVQNPLHRQAHRARDVDRCFGIRVLEDRDPVVGGQGAGQGCRRGQGQATRAGEVDAVTGTFRSIDDHDPGTHRIHLSHDGATAGDREAAPLHVIDPRHQGDRATTGDLDTTHVGARLQGEGGLPGVIHGRERR